MMNRLPLFASVGLSVAALAVALWGPRDAAAPAPSAQSRPAAASGDAVMEQRLKALEETAQLLSRRVMVLEQQRPLALGASDGGAGAVPAGLAQEVEQLRAEVRGMVAGEALQSEGGREYLKSMVRTVQDELRTEQRQERQQQWQQAQAQAQTERAERWRQFVSAAGLNYTQEQELTRRLQDEDTKRQALMEELRAGTKDPRDMRQELRAQRTETDQAMAKVLNDEQKAKYEEMRREDARQNRPGGGGGGRRAGDGPQ
jgi:hypothetical protein